MVGDDYKVWSSSLCNFLYSPVTSTLFGPNILIRNLYSKTLSVCVLPLMWKAKFHTHTNHWQNYGFVCFNLYMHGQQEEETLLTVVLF
jgi:hypothetical protein